MTQIKPDKEVQQRAEYRQDTDDDTPGQLDGWIIPGIQHIQQHHAGEGYHAAEQQRQILKQVVKSHEHQYKLQRQQDKNHHGTAEDDAQNPALSFANQLILLDGLDHVI